MDAHRAARYLAKTQHARERLGQVAEWIARASTEPMARLATYKAFQEASEAAADLAAMMRVDSGDTPQDDRANFGALAERGEVARDAAARLQEATGLRNRLVHEYERLDDTVALRSIALLAPSVAAFLQEVDEWVASKRK